jgi:hypothetical protein
MTEGREVAEPTQQQLVAQVKKLARKLDRRASRHRLIESYLEGPAPFPPAIRTAKMTKAYRLLMPIAEAPWGGLVVESALDRLEIAGIRSADKHAAEVAWGAWQDNKMDSGHMLGHDSALSSGRAFVLVWPEEDGKPEVSLDSPAQMVVEYQEGSRHKRVAALRRWVDEDDVVYATLYRPEGIYKFQQPKADDHDGPDWVRRAVVNTDGTDEPWPVPNPFNVVPVVEVRANPRLKAGCWGHARGEFEHCLGVIDRIHLLTFLGLVVAFWLGFPLRGVIGDKILRDDDGQPIAPFDADPGTIAQLENPNAKFFEYKAADRDNLSIFAELAQFAALTKTPRHYFPLAQAMANLSADAIRADEGALAAKTTKHKTFMGEDWEEVFRLLGPDVRSRRSTSARAPRSSGWTTSRGHSRSAPTPRRSSPRYCRGRHSARRSSTSPRTRSPASPPSAPPTGSGSSSRPRKPAASKGPGRAPGPPAAHRRRRAATSRRSNRWILPSPRRSPPRSGSSSSLPARPSRRGTRSPTTTARTSTSF